MTLIKRLSVLVIALVAVAASASAQFRIGPRVGIDVNSLRFNSDLFDSENRAGFTGGIQAEFTIPIVNLAFDASVMYTRRNSDVVLTAKDPSGNSTEFKGRDYISIPINFKYKIGLPVVGKIITPYIFTGPDFAFLCSKKTINEAYKSKSVDIAWNVGVGLQLVSHLQIGASYGFGITKAVEKVSNWDGAPMDGKSGYWTVTAAWLF